MSSVVDQILDLAVTHLETISGLTASRAPQSEAGPLPYAQVKLDPDGETIAECSQIIYRPMRMRVLVVGGWDSVSDAIEDIQVLWYNGARVTAMAAIGALNIQPAEIVEPYEYEGQLTGAEVEFTLLVQYTY